MQKGFIIIAMAFYALFTPSFSFAQQTVGLFTKNQGELDGYVLFSPNASKFTYLIDKCGRLIHKWNTGDAPGLDAYILPNGELLSTGKVANLYFNPIAGSVGGLVQKFDWNNKLLWSYSISDSRQLQNHDIYPMPNGNILVMIWERFTAAEAIALGRDSLKQKGADVWSIKVQEIKPVNSGDTQVVWQWRLWDHLIQDKDSTKPNYGVISGHPELMNINYIDTTVVPYGSADWTHGNAVTYNPDLDQIMISSRNLSEIYIIDHSTNMVESASHSGGKHRKGGDLLYRWGNPAAYERGTRADRKLFVQHNASWIPDGYPGAGNISVFNDGQGRSDGNYSSADIFAPPVDSNGDYKIDSGKPYGPDSAYWSYKAPVKTSFYSTVQGGAQVLSNGNVLICEATKGNFFEVDSNKNVVWRYVNPDGGSGPVKQGTHPVNIPCFKAMQYMADYPAFKNITLKPGAPLETNPYAFSSKCIMPYTFYINPLYKIAQLKNYNSATGVLDSLNKGQGFIKGIVVSQDLGTNSKQFSIVDSTGAITINTNANYFSPSLGDSVLVGGKVIQTNGLAQYNADTIIVEPTGTWQKQPDTLTKPDERHESDLVRVNNVWLTDTSEWVNIEDTFTVHITNGIDTFMMVINSKTDLYNFDAPLEEFNLTGIEIQNQPSSPYFGNYGIEPRGSFDLERIIQLYKIKDLRIQSPVSGIADSAGSRYNFYLKGIVQSPNFSDTALNFSLKDSTGSIVVVSNSDVGGYKPAIGDSIKLRGNLIQYNGLIEVRVDSINFIGNYTSVLIPKPVLTLGESSEAQLVKLSGYHLVDTTEWAAAGDSFNVHITNGSDTFLMLVNRSTDLFHMKVPYEEFNISGIEIQEQATKPYFGNYAIEPRGLSDIEKIIQLYTIRQIRTQNPITGISDSAGSINDFYLKGIVQSPDFSTTELIFSIKDSTASVIIASTDHIDGYSPQTGDSIVLRGIVTQVNGLTEVVPDSISKLGSGSSLTNAESIKLLSDSTEAKLIKLTDYYLTDTTEWTSTGNKFDVKITNGFDTLLMRINSTTDVFKMKPLHGRFNISGIEIQDKQSSPYFGNYILEPRGITDFERVVQLYKIRDVSLSQSVTGIADSAGSRNSFYLKGIVQSPGLSIAGLDFSIKDSTGSIMVSSSNIINNYAPAIGDSIELRGLLIQVNGLIEVVPDTIFVLSNASPLVKSVIVPGLTQTDKANLVTLNGYYIADTTQWKPSGNGFNVNITNGKDTFVMYVSRATPIYKMKSLKGIFNFTGIEIQDRSTLPYFGNYEIVPRGVFDLQRVLQFYNISQVRVQDPVTGIADSAGSMNNFYLKGIVQSPNMTSIGIKFSIRDSTGNITIAAITDVSGYKPAIGDSIEIRGLLTQVQGLTEIIVDSVSVLKNAGPVLNAVRLLTMSEPYESSIIELDHFFLVDKAQWMPKTGGFKVGITNGTDTLQMFINDNSDLFHNNAPLEEFNVTGVEIQDQSYSPYFGNYEIEPRGSFDIQRLTQLYTVRQVRIQDPLTGIADSLGSPYYFYLKGIVQSPDMTSSGLNFSIMDSTGAIIVTASNVVSGYEPVLGDSIELRGIITQNNGLTEVYTDSITVLKKANILIRSENVTQMSESLEAHLITLSNYYLIDKNQWTPKSGGFEIKITNGPDTVNMFVNDNSDLNNIAAPVEEFNVTGIEIQAQPNAPFFGNYEIEPRGSFDLKRVVQLYKIRQIRIQDPVSGIADSAGSPFDFYLKGVVQSPDFISLGYEFSIKDSTGSVFVTANSQLNSYSPNVGDSILVRGFLIQKNGLTQVKTDSIYLISTGVILSPQNINKPDESKEAHLVKYNNAWLINPAQWNSSGSGFNADITNGIDTVTLFISSNTSAFGMSAPQKKFNVTGIISQDKQSLPFIGNYLLIPRGINDFQFLDYPLYKIRQIKGYNAISGTADSIHTFCYLKGIVQSGNLSGNSSYFFTIQDSTGSISLAYPVIINGYLPHAGDSINTLGEVLQLNGLTYFSPDSISKSSTVSPIAPVLVSALGENLESELITLKGYLLVDSSKWDTTGAGTGFMVKAYNTSDTINIKVVRGTDLFSSAAKPGYNFDISGIEAQEDTDTPYFSGYYIIPRSISDIVHNSGINLQNAQKHDIDIFPNPTSGLVYVRSSAIITGIEISDITGKSLLYVTGSGVKMEKVNINALTKGIYFVKIYNGNNYEIEKVFKN